MPFLMKTLVGPSNHVLDGGANPPMDSGNFQGLSGLFKSKASVIFAAAVGVAVAFAAKWIIRFSTPGKRK